LHHGRKKKADREGGEVEKKKNVKKKPSVRICGKKI